MFKIKIVSVLDHVEVLDENGVFLFSADNTNEALDEIKDMEEFENA